MLEINEVKLWLRVDGTDDDQTIELIIGAAETYLKNATGKEFDAKHNLAKLYCMVLVADWYENRDLIGAQPSDKIRFTIQSMTTQLQYCDIPDDPEEGDDNGGSN